MSDVWYLRVQIIFSLIHGRYVLHKMNTFVREVCLGSFLFQYETYGCSESLTVVYRVLIHGR